MTTGISAQDRAITVRAAVKGNAGPEDLVTPGHIFPIKAQPGGVLTRAGHTEAGVDLARISGYEPASVICEVLSPDGTMARLPDLVEFGRRHKIRIGTIADLISYRLKNDPTVERVSEAYLDLSQGRFRSYTYHDRVEGGVHLALVHGEINFSEPTPVRVHVHRGLLDVVLNPVSPWSWSLENLLETIVRQKCGVVVLLSYNESAEELAGRIELKHRPARATSAGVIEDVNELGNPNLRMLGAGGQILADLGVGKVLALGRQKRAHGLSGFGLEIVDYIADPQQLKKWLQRHA